MPKKCQDSIYFIFRILIGSLFLQHGLQKLFGLLGGTSVPLVSLMGLAGIIEFLGGILIILGLFTKITATIAALEMLIAYFRAHFPNNIIPILNRGELTLLFFSAFLILVIYGAGKYSLDKTFFK